MAIQAARLALPEDNDESLAVLADIDPGAAIGEQLRELRLVKNLTLREVAEKAGISVGYLSQLERNHSRLPIAVLKRISDALGVHMNWFFQQNTEGDPAERDVVVRSTHRRRMSFTGRGIQEELLSPNPSGPLESLPGPPNRARTGKTFPMMAPRPVMSCPALWICGFQAAISACTRVTAFPSKAPMCPAAPTPAKCRCASSG